MNPYDQFDATNPYDRFDAPPAQQQPEPGTIGIGNWRPSLTGMGSGLLNAAASAFSAPADALSGRMAPSDVANRALDFATIASPTSAAMRAGEIVPGMMTRNVAPSAQQLKGAATAGYDAARASSATVPGETIAEMARGMQQSLQGEHGVIAKTAPKTYAILDELASPPAGGVGAYPGLEAARRGLSSIAGEGGTEGFAAQKAIAGLDPFIDANFPEAAAARQNYAAAQRANTITGDLSRGNTGFVERADAAAHASHSGLNFDNNLRQRVKNFLQNENNLRGFSQPEIDALKSVVEGGPVQNATRYAGNLMGGGGGLGGAAIGALLGHYFGGEGELGMMTGLAAGRSLKGVENSLARRSLNSVDDMVRMRSPLAEAMQAQGLLSQPAMTRNDAVLRAILPGLLSQPPQNPNAQMGLLGGYI